MRQTPGTNTLTDRDEEIMTKETIVQTIGILVAVATVAMTVAAVLHEFISG